jgi:hypothetical protein
MAQSWVRKILAQGFCSVVTKGNKATTGSTKDAIVNGYHVVPQITETGTLVYQTSLPHVLVSWAKA